MLMKFWREGDRSVGVCETCKTRVRTVFERRDFALDRPRVVVPDVLLAVCADCERVVAIPPQSSPRLNEARRKELAQLEARVPRHLEDALAVMAAECGKTDKEFRASILRYYLSEICRSATLAKRVKARARSPLAAGKADGRISLRLSRQLLDDVWTAAKRQGIRSKSELVVGLIVAASEDLLDASNSKRQTQLSIIATAS